MISVRSRRLGVCFGAIMIAAMLYFAFIWYSTVHRQPVKITLNDCTKPWSYTCVGSRRLGDALNVHIRGHINGTAALRIAGDQQYLEQSPTESLGPGEVAYTYVNSSWGSEKCVLQYTPTSVSGGSLEVSIDFE